jgi:DNA-directed RNA polymerase specialized sigma24 family protein
MMNNALGFAYGIDREAALDRDAWARLLSFLELVGPASAAHAYERTRERLVRYFKTKGTTHAEELADATLDRIARKLSGEGRVDIRNPMGYVVGVARLIWLERVKAEMSQRARAGHYEESRITAAHDAPELERNVAILDHCLSELPDDERELLLSYHEGRGRARIAHRQELGHARGLPPGLLRTRIHRLRVLLSRRVDELASSS